LIKVTFLVSDDDEIRVQKAVASGIALNKSDFIRTAIREKLKDLGVKS